MRPYSLPYYSHDCKRSQHNTVAFIFYSQSRHIAFTVTGTTVMTKVIIEQNRALHDGLIYISASPLVAVLFFVYDYSINISAKEKAL